MCGGSDGKAISRHEFPRRVEVRHWRVNATNLVGLENTNRVMYIYKHQCLPSEQPDLTKQTYGHRYPSQSSI